MLNCVLSVSRARARDTFTLLEHEAYSLFVLGCVKDLPVDGSVRVDLVESFFLKPD